MNLSEMVVLSAFNYKQVNYNVTLYLSQEIFYPKAFVATAALVLSQTSFARSVDKVNRYLN